LTVLELVEVILAKMGKAQLVPAIHNTATGEIQQQWLSCEKARRVLGWTPTASLDEGLTETIAWYTRYLETAWDTPLLAS